MSTINTLLLLGTNLGNRNSNLKKARNLITVDIGSIEKEGEIVETEPVGFTSSDLFLNQLILVRTTLSPIQLLKRIKSIENTMGRTYTTPFQNEIYTSRIIDIDILKMETVKYQCTALNIPHTQINTREFVRIMLENF